MNTLRKEDVVVNILYCMDNTHAQLGGGAMIGVIDSRLIRSEISPTATRMVTEGLVDLLYNFICAHLAEQLGT